MTGQHFKELVETICMTYKVKKKAVYTQLGISQAWYNYYERNGVPVQVKPLIMKRLRMFYIAKQYGM